MKTNFQVVRSRSLNKHPWEPAGWVMDTQAAKPQQLEAVLYREGSSWKDAVAVMYARVIHKDETQDTIEK